MLQLNNNRMPYDCLFLSQMIVSFVESVVTCNGNCFICEKIRTTLNNSSSNANKIVVDLSFKNKIFECRLRSVLHSITEYENEYISFIFQRYRVKMYSKNGVYIIIFQIYNS